MITRTFRQGLLAFNTNQSGVALIEFAYSLPILLTLGLGGLETANYAIANQRTNQIAMMVADNASRPRSQITESYVAQLFTGVDKAGGTMNFKQNGKVILSSVQNNAAGTAQWVRWQRCFGMKAGLPTYKEGDGQTGTSPQNIVGLQAMAGSAIMIAEVNYDYQPIIPNSFLSGKTIKYSAAAVVRQRTDFGISGTNTAPCTT